MNVKKSLENRIHGWFPKEPYLISTRVKVDCETKQPPLMIPPEYNVTATKTAAYGAIIWTFFYFFTSFLLLSLESFNFPMLLAWIIAGSAVGVISGTMYTQNQIRRVSRDYLILPNRKDMILAIVPMLIFFIFVSFVSWFLYDASLRGSASLGPLVSVCASLISSQVIRYAVLRAYEKRESMRLMQSWFGGAIALIPKAPNSNANPSEIPASRIRKNSNLLTVIFTSAIALILLGVTMFIDWPFPIETILWIATFSVVAICLYLNYRRYTYRWYTNKGT
jgi:hypothetical protein